MVQINFAKREINCKLVYYGPGLSGKTTNLEVVHKKAPASKKGELTSIATEGDRTLFFDYMPLELGKVGGMNTKFQLYTVPGQVYYNATRTLVLQGADGVVFVADSQPDKMDENLESFQNLEENLREQGLDPKTIPMVLQWNKRDLPNVLSPEELDAKMNKYGAPTFEAVAVTGDGVFPTLKKLAQIVLEKLNREYGLQNDGPGGGGAAAAKEPAKEPAKAAPAAASAPPKKDKPVEAPKPAPEPARPKADDRAAEREKERERAERERERAERDRERERAEKERESRPKPRDFNVSAPTPEPAKSGGGKGFLVLVLLLVLIGGAVGAGYMGKLGPLQMHYDQHLRQHLGGGTP
ncbi:MAG: GTPase domain-containing protein, partial [Planctomycetota bacterium]|nr:GTPase domain-containing protein [Planctomycetota bacterium]